MEVMRFVLLSVLLAVALVLAKDRFPTLIVAGGGDHTLAVVPASNEGIACGAGIEARLAHSEGRLRRVERQLAQTQSQLRATRRALRVVQLDLLESDSGWSDELVIGRR